MADRKRVVILGGGFAGLIVARKLARTSKGALDIVLVDASTVHVFLPWIYEIASGNPGATRQAQCDLVHSASLSFTKVLKGSAVRFRRAQVTGCDPEHKHVLLEGGQTLSYDVLVVALGAQTAYFGIAGLKEYALAFKSAADADAIRERFTYLLEELKIGKRKTAHVLVAGGGPSGCELITEFAGMRRKLEAAGELMPKSLQLTLVDAGSRPLAMCSPRLSRATVARLRRLDVTMAFDTMVTEAQQNGVFVKPRGDEQGATTSPYKDGDRLTADILVWCGGVGPNAALANFPLPKEPRGRLRVATTFEVQEYPNVFALGDAAFVQDVRTQAALPQTAQAAVRAAVHVAKNIQRVTQGKPPRPFIIPRKWPFVVTLGGKWGVAEVGPLMLKGPVGYVIRMAADAEYFFRILPPREALRTWWRGVTMYTNNDE